MKSNTARSASLPTSMLPSRSETPIALAGLLEVNLEAGIIKDITNGNELNFKKIPEVMLNILSEGGLIPYIKKHGDFKL